MIKLFRSFKSSKLEPDSTNLYDEHTFFKKFSADLRLAKSEVIIESPYITVRRATEFSQLLVNSLSKNLKVVLYTRNPNDHEQTLRHQSIQGIEILRRAGVKVVLCNDMRHRKIACIDRTILWEGSLNMMSQNNSKEIMRRTNSSVLCSEMLRFTGLISIFSGKV